MHGSDLAAYQGKFGGFGWHTIVIDGHNLEEILSAFENAEQEKGRPTAILARTHKGQGVSFLADRDGWHGKALKPGEETEKALLELPLRAVSIPIQIRLPRGGATSGKAERQPVAAPGYKPGEWVATRKAVSAGPRRPFSLRARPRKF